MKRYNLVKSTTLNPNLLIYIDLKLIICKILSITFIVAIFLLSHISIVFQSISIRLNLSESLSKSYGYEYTNVIFRAVTHLF